MDGDIISARRKKYLRLGGGKGNRLARFSNEHP